VAEITHRLFVASRAGNPGRRRCGIWLAGLVLPALACAQGSGHDTEVLQWHALRTQQGHFDGARWNDELDRWQGRKHQLMQALARRAREQSAAEAALLQWMGPPDARWKPGQAEHGTALQNAQWQGRPPGQSELLVYNWRARHDRLVFAMHGGRVVATGWLLTLE
jgi:hypothetical protein